MPQPFAQLAKRQRGLVIAAALVATMGWAVYHGTRDTRDLLDKRAKVQKLEEENEKLREDNTKRREHIEGIKSNPVEQDLEIRKMNMLKPGEETFKLPEAEKAKPDQQAPAPAK